MISDVPNYERWRTFVYILVPVSLLCGLHTFQMQAGHFVGHFFGAAGNSTSRNMTGSSRTRILDKHKYRPRGAGTALIYTPFFGDWNYGYPRLGDVPFKHCRYDNCKATRNKSQTELADVILFHCRNIPPSFPQKRHPHQIYVVYCLESPYHSNFVPFNNTINATATYRMDSDIHTPYSAVSTRTIPVKGKYIPKNLFANKTNAAVWAVSHCRSPSKRRLYANELAKHYKVDIYGKCGPHKCPKSEGSKCLQKFEKKYKFFLSFENSICTGYVTEKFFSPLMYELVPVVYGGANYSLLAPKHSYINTADYKSPKDLAKYLTYLSNNEEEYNKYFQWKQSYTVGNSHNQSLFCQLCEMINENKFRRSAWDVSRWWSGPGVCQNSYINRFMN